MLGATLEVRDGKLIGKPKGALDEMAAQIRLHREGIKRFILWSQSGKLTRRHSRLRGSDIWIAADNATVPGSVSPGDLYRASEIVSLGGLSRQMIKSVHKIKKEFDGQITEEEL
jgi:hypothetical protein